MQRNDNNNSEMQKKKIKIHKKKIIDVVLSDCIFSTLKFIHLLPFLLYCESNKKKNHDTYMWTKKN